MKKNILIFCTVITAPAITAYGVNSWKNSPRDQGKTSQAYSVTSRFNPNCLTDLSNSNFYYDVNSRFTATITKEKLHHAKSIIDLVPEEGTNGIESFRDVKIGIFADRKDKFAEGKSNVLNSAQLNLLQSANYSTNFYIEAFCKRKNADTGKIEDQCFVYYVTIVPEKEAEYKDGHKALMDYLKNNSKEKSANVENSKLKSGKVRFTVKQNGEIANVKLESTSGYSSIDIKMIELITDMPEQWTPATDSQGKNVDQELVFSFGLIGC